MAAAETSKNRTEEERTGLEETREDTFPSMETPSIETSAEEGLQEAGWVENEGLLRDEGTLFGLAGLEDGREHKVEGIRKHFEAKKTQAQRNREALSRDIESIGRRRSDVEEKIGRLESRIEDPPVPEVKDVEEALGDVPARHTLLRYVLGALFAAGICGFNFYLLLELFGPYFKRPGLVVAGIFCAGLFSLFQPTSLFFGGSWEGRVAPWKRWLVEVGMPVVAAAFAAGWTYRELGPVRAAALFAYLAMVFLLGGKLLLSTIPRLTLSLRVLWGDLRAWWIRLWARRKRDRLREEVLPQLAEKEETLKRRREEALGPEEIDSRCEAAVELFRSEYALAREAAESGLINSDVRQSITNSADRDETVA